MAFFSKPDPKKNFFQNYSDHIDYLMSQLQEVGTAINNAQSMTEALNIINDEATKRMNMMESLRDGYDYMDEFVGATAIPTMGLIASLAMLGLAVWEGAQTLAARVRREETTEHTNTAVENLFFSALLFTASIATLLKSIVSMVSRPVVTAIKGFAEQNTPRFEREGSPVSVIKEAFI